MVCIFHNLFVLREKVLMLVTLPIENNLLKQGSLFRFAVLCVFSSFTLMLLGKRELFCLLLLFSECHVTVIVL